MHQSHDLDLVAALAQGRLDDTTDAERLVSTCDVCAAAYRDHVAVLAAIATSETPRLDDLERRRLRAAVWDQVTSEQPARSPAGLPWWKIGQVAAALVVVVGVGATLANLSNDGDTDSFTAATDALVISEASAAITESNEAGAAADSAMADSTDTTMMSDETMLGEADDGATNTTMTSDTMETTEDLAGDDDSVARLADDDALAILLSELVGNDVEYFEAANEELRTDDPCLAQDPADYAVADKLVATRLATVGGRPLIIQVYDTGDDLVAVAYEMFDCEIVASTADPAP